MKLHQVRKTIKKNQQNQQKIENYQRNNFEYSFKYKFLRWKNSELENMNGRQT